MDHFSAVIVVISCNNPYQNTTNCVVCALSSLLPPSFVVQVWSQLLGPHPISLEISTQASRQNVPFIYVIAEAIHVKLNTILHTILDSRAPQHVVAMVKEQEPLTNEHVAP